MDLKAAVGVAVRAQRLSCGLSQESIGESQSYVSDVERGLKSPSVEKIDQLATLMGIHPLTLVAKAYLIQNPNLTADGLLERLRLELTVP
jgi:transcriptional regulator with XRE-family HTH domain